MKLDSFLNVPKWFSVRSPQQEETIDHAIRDFEGVEELQKREFDKAKADALPYMAEVVRDMDGLDESRVRGGTRPWNAHTYARVMAAKRKADRRKKWKKLFSYLFPISAYEHS